MVDREDDARRAQEARARTTAAAREADRKALQESRDEQAKANTEAMRRQGESQPTPTQEENDLARLGQHVMDKEDDGSAPDFSNLSPGERKRREDEYAKRRTAEPSSSAPYRTRESTAPKPAASPKT